MSNYYNDGPKEVSRTGELGLYDERLNAVARLKNQRKDLMDRVGKIDSLLLILEKNPDLEKVLNLSRELL
jgi:hypothetical protein